MKMDIVSAIKRARPRKYGEVSRFSDAVVSVSSDSENVNVFINSSELTYDTAQSSIICSKRNGRRCGNIIIARLFGKLKKTK
ncbi:MAG: hypothetical protein ACLRSW_08715 [Christensenellaceae bacterium]